MTAVTCDDLAVIGEAEPWRLRAWGEEGGACPGEEVGVASAVPWAENAATVSGETGVSWLFVSTVPRFRAPTVFLRGAGMGGVNNPGSAGF